MTDKEAIEIVNRIRIDFFDSKYKEEHSEDELAEKYEALCLVLNLIETYRAEIEKKDNIIDEMARMLVEVSSSPSDAPMTAVAKAMIHRDLELHKWQVINYVRNKVEKENK